MFVNSGLGKVPSCAKMHEKEPFLVFGVWHHFFIKYGLVKPFFAFLGQRWKWKKCWFLYFGLIYTLEYNTYEYREVIYVFYGRKQELKTLEKEYLKKNSLCFIWC